MSLIASSSRHRKPRTSGARSLAVRAGMAGGMLTTIVAGTASAAPASHAPGHVTDAAASAAQPEQATLTQGLTEGPAQTADALQTVAARYELEAARDAAAARAAEAAEKATAKAEAEAEARAEAAREAAEREAAEEAASRGSERTTLAATSSDSASSAEAPASGSVASVISFLRAQVGKPYVLGASGPSSWDCSSLVQSAFKQAGVDLPRVSQDQSAQGTQVSLDALQPGDILAWGGVGSAYHVAVYVGDGTYIDAANPSKGVVEQNLSDWPPTSASRVL